MQNKLLSRMEVAARLGVSLATLDRIITRGEIPVIRPNGLERRGRVLIRPEDVAEWMRVKASRAFALVPLLLSV